VRLVTLRLRPQVEVLQLYGMVGGPVAP
jgi:hypothetical protein